MLLNTNTPQESSSHRQTAMPPEPENKPDVWRSRVWLTIDGILVVLGIAAVAFVGLRSRHTTPSVYRSMLRPSHTSLARLTTPQLPSTVPNSAAMGSSWPRYVDFQFGYSFRYPSTVKVTQLNEEKGMVDGVWIDKPPAVSLVLPPSSMECPPLPPATDNVYLTISATRDPVKEALTHPNVWTIPTRETKEIKLAGLDAIEVMPSTWNAEDAQIGLKVRGVYYIFDGWKCFSSIARKVLSTFQPGD